MVCDMAVAVNATLGKMARSGSADCCPKDGNPLMRPIDLKIRRGTMGSS
jgi:hypothetical protein